MKVNVSHALLSTMRPPANKTERFRAALCSTDDDIWITDNGQVVVSGVLPGTIDRIYLGGFAETTMYHKGVNTKALIQHILFGYRRNLHERITIDEE